MMSRVVITLLQSTPLLLLLLSLSLSVFPGGVAGFSIFNVTSACNTMYPGHLALGAQDTPSPFSIHITPKENGSYYYVTVYGKKKQEFKGFLLEAKDEGDESVGRFTEVQNSGRIIDCFFPGGGVQHNSGQGKRQVSAQWEPRQFTGKLQFRATVVQSYNTFWTNVISQPLTV